jgi:hypothetical protein
MGRDFEQKVTEETKGLAHWASALFQWKNLGLPLQ